MSTKLHTLILFALLSATPCWAGSPKYYLAKAQLESTSRTVKEASALEAEVARHRTELEGLAKKHLTPHKRERSKLLLSGVRYHGLEITPLVHDFARNEVSYQVQERATVVALWVNAAPLENSAWTSAACTVDPKASRVVLAVEIQEKGVRKPVTARIPLTLGELLWIRIKGWARFRGSLLGASLRNDLERQDVDRDTEVRSSKVTIEWDDDLRGLWTTADKPALTRSDVPPPHLEKVDGAWLLGQLTTPERLRLKLQKRKPYPRLEHGEFEFLINPLERDRMARLGYGDKRTLPERVRQRVLFLRRSRQAPTAAQLEAVYDLLISQKARAGVANVIINRMR